MDSSNYVFSRSVPEWISEYLNELVLFHNYSFRNFLYLFLIIYYTVHLLKLLIKLVTNLMLHFPVLCSYPCFLFITWLELLSSCLRFYFSYLKQNKILSAAYLWIIYFLKHYGIWSWIFLICFTISLHYHFIFFSPRSLDQYMLMIKITYFMKIGFKNSYGMLYKGIPHGTKTDTQINGTE